MKKHCDKTYTQFQTDTACELSSLLLKLSITNEITTHTCDVNKTTCVHGGKGSHDIIKNKRRKVTLTGWSDFCSSILKGTSFHAFAIQLHQVSM